MLSLSFAATVSGAILRLSQELRSIGRARKRLFVVHGTPLLAGQGGFDAGAAGVSFDARGVVLRDQSSHRPKPVTCSTPHSGKASNANPRATMTQNDSVKREGTTERAP